MPEPARLAVLASGGGTNLQALLDRFHGGGSGAAKVALVVGGREGIGALERAERAGVPSTVLDPALDAEGFGDALLAALEEHRVDLVVLAGWLRLIPSRVVEAFRGRMVNVHPALLPAFGGRGMYGMRVHRAVIESGARVSGATVHLVDDRYDTGPIVAQWPVPVLAGDTAETLAARVLAVEHRLFPAAIEALVRGDASGSAGSASDPLCFDLRADPAPDAASVLRTMRLPDASASDDGPPTP